MYNTLILMSTVCRNRDENGSDWPLRRAIYLAHDLKGDHFDTPAFNFN